MCVSGQRRLGRLTTRNGLYFLPGFGIQKGKVRMEEGEGGGEYRFFAKSKKPTRGVRVGFRKGVRPGLRRLAWS